MAEQRGWYHEVQVLPEALRVDPLLVRHGHEVPLARFAADLRAVLCQRRTLHSVARQWLEKRDFAALAPFLSRLPPDEAEALREEAQSELQGLISDLERQHEELQRRAQHLSAAGHESGAEEYLEAARRALAALPRQVLVTPSAELLTQLREAPFKELDEALQLAHMACDDAEKKLRRQREQERKELLQCKQSADRVLDALTVDLDPERDAERLDRIDRLRAVLNSTFRLQDLAQIKTLLQHARALESGEALPDLPESLRQPAVAPAPRPGTSEHRGSLRRGDPARLEDLSWLAREELTREGQKGAEGRPRPEQDLLVNYAPRIFDKGRLEPVLGAARRAWQGDKSARLGPRLFLDAAAKLRLLEQRFLIARILFGDALLWSSEEEDEGRWRDTAAWGFLLAILLPRLTLKERDAALRPEGLAALCERKIGLLPLGLFEREQLFAELGAHLFHLAPSAAALLFRDYLRSYLSAHHNAAAGLLSGVSAELPGALARAPQALEWLALVLADLLPESGSPVVSALRKAAKGFRVERPRPSLNELCEGLAPWKDRFGLVDALQESLKTATDRLDREAAEPSHRLVTRELVLTPGAHIVVEVSSRGALLRDLETRVELSDGTSAIKEACGPVQGARYMLPDEKLELTIPLLRTDAALLRASEILVRQSTSTQEGVPRVFEDSSFQIKFLPAAPTAALVPNPYVVGDPLKTTGVFYGRSREIAEICMKLIGANQDNVVLVQGERRIGKTSLLRKLEHFPEVKSRYDVAFIDLQDVKKVGMSPANFFRSMLLSPLRDRLQHFKVPVPGLDERLFHENPNQGFDRFMEMLDETYQPRPRRLLLILDEIGYLLEAIDNAQRSAPGLDKDQLLGMDIIATLRKVIQKSTRISFILSGATHQVRSLTDRREALLFNLPVQQELKELEETAARALIDDPVAAHYKMLPSAVDLILRETNRQPYLIQQVCRHLFDRLAGRRALTATLTDVLGVIDEEIISNSSYFTHLSDLLQSDRERSIVRALAALQTDRYVLVEDLRGQLKRSGVSLKSEELQQELLSMQARSRSLILQRSNSRMHFRLPVGLYARHLRTQNEDLRGLRLSAR